MLYYQEISTIEQTGMSDSVILSDVCSAIHSQVTKNKDIPNSSFGVSFPNYKYNSRADKGTLGNTLRVFCDSKELLELLGLESRLESISDYLKIGAIEEVGDKATHYEVYSRVHKKGLQRKAENLYEHIVSKYGEEELVKRFGDFQGVLDHCRNTGQSYRQYPYIQTKSNSNRNNYIIRLKKSVVKKPSDTFEFSSFGVNQGGGRSTVPAW